MNYALSNGFVHVKGFIVGNAVISGGTTIKDGTFDIHQSLIWTAGSITGVGNLTLDGATNITQNVLSDGGNIVNNAYLSIFNPNTPASPATCLTLNSNLYNLGTLKIDDNCTIIGSGHIYQQGASNLTFGYFDSLNVSLALDNPSTETVSVVLPNVIYLNAGATLGGTLNISSDGSKRKDKDTLVIFYGANISGSFNYIAYKPQPQTSSGNNFKVEQRSSTNQYALYFNSANSMIASVLLVVLIFML